MFNNPSRQESTNLLHRGWELVYDVVEMIVMLIFMGVSMFPAQALAFNNDVELSHLPLVFDLDPTLEGVAIVGIEAWPKERTVARVLRSESLEVRSTLAEGSVVRVLSVAYSSTVGQTDANPFVTASGEWVREGTLATNFLAFGTKVRIGDNIYTVTDRMNARYNGKYIVDIWQPSKAQALQYGARIVDMEVVALP